MLEEKRSVPREIKTGSSPCGSEASSSYFFSFVIAIGSESSRATKLLPGLEAGCRGWFEIKRSLGSIGCLPGRGTASSEYMTQEREKLEETVSENVTGPTLLPFLKSRRGNFKFPRRLYGLGNRSAERRQRAEVGCGNNKLHRNRRR